MKTTFRKKYLLESLAIVLFLLTLLTLWAIFSKLRNVPQSIPILTPTITSNISDYMNQLFTDVVGAEIEFNQEISIFTASLIPGSDHDGQDLWGIWVKNNVDEEIIIPAGETGVKLYWANLQTSTWEEVQMRFRSPQDQISLEPKLRTVSTTNTIIIFWRYISSDEHAFRVLIVGTGVETGKRYGVYVDIDFAP